MRGRTIQKGMNHMAKQATGTTDKEISTHTLVEYVKQLLEQIQADLEHPEVSPMGERRTFVLTHPKNSTNISGVNRKCQDAAKQENTMATELVELHAPAPHLAKRAVQEKYKHRCAVCGGEWIGEDDNPSECIYCRTTTWRTGKTKWDLRRERKAKQAQ